MDELRLALQQLRKFELAGGTHTTLPFVPEADLFDLLSRSAVETVLENSVFGVAPHQRKPFSVEVAEGARKLFAILVELRIEHKLKKCLEKNLSDSSLPILDKTRLDGLFPESATHFQKLQWEYVPFKLREHAHKDLESERVLPFVENKKLSSGGFSTVFTVKIHPLYHDFKPCPGEQRYVRKEISSSSSYEVQRKESDLLFLLRSLENDNLVQIVTSYTQDGLCNLLFPAADGDLHDLLINDEQPIWCRDSAQVVDSFRGLANGIHYLHNFRPLSKTKEESERITKHGYHHDIKPRNVLIRGCRLILADFGLARLKNSDEDTQTQWKKTPPTYAAPEARDPVTLQERNVGRAYDIWSFGCILGEFVTYSIEGAAAVRDFRKERIVEGAYGAHNCFHHEGELNPAVDEWYRKMKQKHPNSSKSLLFATSSWLLNADSRKRPMSGEVVEMFDKLSLSRYLLNIIFHIDVENSDVSQELPPVYRSKLTLEKNRLRAWGYAHGLQAFAEQMQAIAPELSERYDSLHQILKTCSTKLANLIPQHYNGQDVQEQVLETATATNNALLLETSKLVKLTVENTFQLLTVSATKTVKLLADSSNAMAPGASQNSVGHDQDTLKNREIGLLAAARYASLILSSPNSLVTAGAVTMIDYTLLSNVIQPMAYASHMTCRWYYHGYREIDKQKVLVEEISYAGGWTAIKEGQKFADIGKEVLERVQQLAQLFQMRPKHKHMRLLQSLGAYHLPSLQKFGFVYEFPHGLSDYEPVSLATIIHKTKEPEKNPTLNVKFGLAQTITSCMHALHLAGWIHKDIRSSNFIVLQDSGKDMAKVDLMQLYLTGFQNSRQLEQGAYSEGIISMEEKASIHPAYSREGVGFHSGFEYYALGVLLLEIAIWRPLDKLFPHDASTDVIRRLLLGHAQKYIPSRMGTGYCEVVLACMGFYDKYGGENKAPNLLLRFQEEILEKLHQSSLPM